MGADDYWLSITDKEEEDIWKDHYTQEVVQYNGPFIGGRPNGGKRENCAVQTISRTWIDWFCEDKEHQISCVCNNKEKHHLKLRGLCQYSVIDSLFMPWNARQDIRNLEFISAFGTTIPFNENQKSWILQTKSEQDTRGRSASPLVSFALGKHQWVIENDTVECGEDGSYMVDLKL